VNIITRVFQVERNSKCKNVEWKGPSLFEEQRVMLLEHCQLGGEYSELRCWRCKEQVDNSRH
jgi:hypothetical protein